MLAAAALSLHLGCGSDSGTGATNPPGGGGGGGNNPPPTPTTQGPNNAPTVQITDRSPKNSTIVVGGTRFSLRATGTDPDGDSLTYTWNWDDGSPRDHGGGASHIFNREGEFRVEVTAEDGRGGKSTDHTTITARKLSGTWRVENARHFDLHVEIQQNNGPGVFGTMSDSAGVAGQVRDPYRITLNVNAANGFCIPSGTYTGTINPQVTEIVFPGPGCKNFSFIR
jgi:hypothetical protein